MFCLARRRTQVRREVRVVRSTKALILEIRFNEFLPTVLTLSFTLIFFILLCFRAVGAF